MNVEALAKLLHEAGREAVLANKVHKPDGAPVGQIVFKEWHEISEDAREGRRMQARYLLARLTMLGPGDTVTITVKCGVCGGLNQIVTNRVVVNKE